MALKNPSLMLYGFTVDVSNQYIDFKISAIGLPLQAIVASGSYSLTNYAAAIATALQMADPSNTYTVTVNRNIAGGTQNRITIATSGSFLSLLFGSGAAAGASIATTAGFNASDYTGATSYTGSSSTGTAVKPVLYGYNWVAPTRNKKIFGNVNVSATGLKEAVVFQIQKFFEVEFKYEPESVMETVWEPFWNWAIQQKDLEFTPDVTQPDTYYQCTLESTEADSEGLGFMMKEMLPEFPGLFQTGKLKFRQNIEASEFISGG